MFDCWPTSSWPFREIDQLRNAEWLFSPLPTRGPRACLDCRKSSSAFPNMSKFSRLTKSNATTCTLPWQELSLQPTYLSCYLNYSGFRATGEGRPHRQVSSLRVQEAKDGWALRAMQRSVGVVVCTS